MRVLVTGGAGYIGSFTVRALREGGHVPIVFDNMSFGHREAVQDEIMVGDLGDEAALESCFAGRSFDAVIHFAAFIEAGESMEDAARFFKNNTANSVNLLNAAVRHGVKLFVFSSTAGVYGDPVRIPIKESDPAIPINVYAETKLLVERMLPWYGQVHGLRSVALRYFNAAGGALDGSMGQDHEPASHLITLAIQAALGQRTFTLNGEDYATRDGTCIRDYIHVLDLADAHVVALDYLERGGANATFNVGAGTGYTNWEVIDCLKRISGVDFPVSKGPRRPGDPRELVADVSLARDWLGWSSRYSDLDTIVSSAWKWHSAHPRGYEG